MDWIGLPVKNTCCPMSSLLSLSLRGRDEFMWEGGGDPGVEYATVGSGAGGGGKELLSLSLLVFLACVRASVRWREG